MKRRQIVKWLVLLAVALVATVAWGDLISRQYHGVPLTPVQTAWSIDWPQRLYFTILFVSFVGVIVVFLINRRLKSARVRKVGRVLLLGTLGMGVMVIMAFVFGTSPWSSRRRHG